MLDWCNRPISALFVLLCFLEAVINAELIACGVTTKYIYNSSPNTNGLNSGAVVKYAFMSSKAFWQSSVHSNAFLRILKNDKHLSMALEINLLKAATRPMSDWTSLIFCGGFISSIA